jgi:TPR repeat protein
MQTDCHSKLGISSRHRLVWLLPILFATPILLAPRYVLAIAAPPPDIEKTRRSADAGDATAQSTLGSWYRWGEYGIQADQKLAGKWYLKAARQGYIQAEEAMGEMYEFGEGVQRDHAKALHWIRKATVKDSTGAIPIARRYAEHAVTPADVWSAIEWYRISAEAGNPDAQTELGFLYEASAVRRFDEAAQWFRKAAQTSAPAMAAMGRLCATGEGGVSQDYKQAAYWYRKAIAADGRSGQYELGLLYERGLGVPQDPVRAMELYHAAAVIDFDAQRSLFKLYEAHLNVPSDPEKAIAWYREAAEGGNAQAQIGLGMHYEFGRGVGANLDVASALYNLAARSREAGNPNFSGFRPTQPQTESLLNEMAKPRNLLKAIDYFVAHAPHPAPVMISD